MTTRQLLGALVPLALLLLVGCRGEGGPTDGGPASDAAGADVQDATAAVADATAEATADATAAPPLELGVMTFNVMCSVCDLSYDPWDERLAYFGDIFARHDPDLIGLQEPILADEVDQIVAAAPGFAALFYVNPDDLDNPDATILYRAARFDVLDHGTYWLSPTPDVPYSMGFADDATLPRLLVWARLHDHTSGRDLLFATTHFDSTPPSQEKSAPLVLERTAPLAAELPTIVVGDFNADPSEAAYLTLTGGAQPGGFHLTDAFTLATAWRADANRDPAPPYDPAHRIDHVFVAGGDWACHDWLVDLWVYGDRDLFPSDHWPIHTELALP